MFAGIIQTKTFYIGFCISKSHFIDYFFICESHIHIFYYYGLKNVKNAFIFVLFRRIWCQFISNFDFGSVVCFAAVQHDFFVVFQGAGKEIVFSTIFDLEFFAQARSVHREISYRDIGLF